MYESAIGIGRDRQFPVVVPWRCCIRITSSRLTFFGLTDVRAVRFGTRGSLQHVIPKEVRPSRVSKSTYCSLSPYLSLRQTDARIACSGHRLTQAARQRSLDPIGPRQGIRPQINFISERFSDWHVEEKCHQQIKEPQIQSMLLWSVCIWPEQRDPESDQTILVDDHSL